MAKYSFIVPVYNTASYLKTCLESLLGQTYDDFEIIIVNDGSTDNSKSIIKKYMEDRRVKLVNQKNQGLSAARNNGVKLSTGKYIFFVDSDDYVENDLLEVIDTFTKDEPDVIRFQLFIEEENKVNIKKQEEVGFNVLDGPSSFSKICEYKYVECAWCYAYKRSFYIKNKFSFAPGKFHEDFGLIPYVIMKAKKVLSTSYAGYHYIQRKGSIMHTNDYEKNIKKAFDILEQYIDMKSKLLKIEVDNYSKRKFLSFIANSAILKLSELSGEEYHKYLKLLKENKAFDDLLDDTLTRKIKKLIIKINPKLYLKVVR